MRYRVWHKTSYRYGSPVPLSHNQIRVHPRVMDCQRVISSEVTVDPSPVARRMWADPFGNLAEFFSIEQSHELMSVTATSIVERSLPFTRSPQIAWRDLVSAVKNPQRTIDRFAAQFQFDSKYAYRTPGVMEFASQSLLRNNDLLAAVKDLMGRIFSEFRYRAASTTIETTLQELLDSRSGVCQDFAQLMIAGLRCFGIPARYVSGYILTHPAPGQVKMVGSDASHAWVSVYAGDGHWVDFDPTNNIIVGDEHITLAWGRDYADVSPIQGILIGGGAPKLTVNVDVSQIKNNSKELE